MFSSADGAIDSVVTDDSHDSVTATDADSSEEEAQVQSYSRGGANVPTQEGTLAQYLASTVKPSVCGCDAVLYQITLTTCLYLHFLLLNHKTV